MNDNEIIELFFARSEQAILASSGKYGGYCGRIAGNMLKNPQDREECLSDTWLTAWNTIPPTRPDHLGPFLGKITRNLCLSRLRSQGTLKRGGGTVQVALEELSDCIPSGDSTEEAVEQRELTELLNRFLSGLKPETRVAFMSLSLYQTDESGALMPTLVLPIVESPILQCDGEIAVHNDAANADGMLTQVHVSTGCIELVLNHEYVEQWCNREIVPVGPDTFCKMVYGDDWVSAGPSTDGAYFSPEDERDIFQGYNQTWNDVMQQEIAPTVTLHFQDVSTLALEGEPTADYSYLSSVEDHDAVVYRWLLYPVINLDTVMEIEILGQTYPLTPSEN